MVVKVFSTLVIVLSCSVISQHAPDLIGRIVGGKPVNIDHCPYQLSLRQDNSHICGASLLDQTTALTAAHCIDRTGRISLSVAGGSRYLYGGDEVKIGVARVIIHKLYQSTSEDYDIAILKLKSPANYSQFFSPIPLPSASEKIGPPSTGIVTGWGFTKERGELSPVLRRVELPIVDRSTCAQLYKGEGEITSRMICAGSVRGGADSCQGDSGGPLICNGKLFGVVSWGYGCARPGYPGVYTYVPKFINWIERNRGN